MPVGKRVNMRDAGKRLAVESNVDPVLKRYLDEITPLRKRVSSVQARRYAAAILRGQEARQQMINANLLLVATIAAVYSGMGIPIKDVISFGNQGLMLAVDRFKPGLGSFSTFATWHIRAACTRGIANTATAIRLPHNVQAARAKLYTLDTLAISAAGAGLSDAQAAEALGMTVKAIRRIRAAQDTPLSLELQIKNHGTPAPESPADSESLGERISDGHGSAEDQALAGMDQTALASALPRALAGLSERERAVLAARYPGGKQEATPYEALGRTYGVSHTRIGQIERAALAKLRTALEGELGDDAPQIVAAFLAHTA